MRESIPLAIDIESNAIRLDTVSKHRFYIYVKFLKCGDDDGLRDSSYANIHCTFPIDINSVVAI